LESSRILTFFGTHTRGASGGIYRAWFDAVSGTFSETELAIEAANPTFLAVCPIRDLLFSTSELPATDGRDEGALFAYSVDKWSGDLRLINRVFSGGMNPSFVDCDHTEETVVTSNIRGGSVASFRIKPDGGLQGPSSVIEHETEGAGAHPRLQDAPHPHSIRFDPEGKFALACDRGSDRILIYQKEAETARLMPHKPHAIVTAHGAGPRHCVFHPNSRAVYVLNELNSTVTIFRYDPDEGRMEETETASTLPEGFAGENMTAEIEVSACGRFLFCSNRGHNSIAMFRVRANGRQLKQLGHYSTHGDWPRTIRIDPTGSWLVAANERTSDAYVFRIDPDNGKLTSTGAPLTVINPTCVQFFFQTSARE
jgi:6-phosphogluconolactonase